MEINFIYGYTLTTDHPASNYGAGVLVDNDGKAYAPDEYLPGLTFLVSILLESDILPITAGDFIMSVVRTGELELDSEDIAFIRSSVGDSYFYKRAL
jgi:hypothetical protein